MKRPARLFRRLFSAFNAIKKFRDEAPFSTWLTGITMNHARNLLKRIRSISHHKASSIDDPIETGNGQISGNPSTKQEPILEQLEKKELSAKVQACINTLDDEFKEVLVLRDIQEFSYNEIRDSLNIPEGTIKSRLYKAREAMRNCLKNGGFGNTRGYLSSCLYSVSFQRERCRYVCR